MKTGPCAAVTLAVRLNDMSDDESVNIELIESPRTYQQLQDQQATPIDIVVALPSEILYFKSGSSGFDFTSSLLGNEKSIKALEEVLERRAGEALSVLTQKL